MQQLFYFVSRRIATDAIHSSTYRVYTNEAIVARARPHSGASPPLASCAPHPGLLRHARERGARVSATLSP